MNEDQKRKALLWLIRIVGGLLLLGGLWQIKAGKNAFEDFLGLNTDANTQACELIDDDIELDAKLKKMYEISKGTLRATLDRYLEFENSETYTANSLNQAKTDLASVYQICSELLANKEIRK